MGSAPDLRTIAIHEAAHVVVAHSLGLPARSSSIRRTKFSEARTELPRPRVAQFGTAVAGKPLTGIARRVYEEAFMWLVAGAIAEAIYLSIDQVTVSSTDAKRAHSYVNRITLDEAERSQLRDSLGYRVMEFLQDPKEWRKVEQLADALVARKFLSASQIAAIVPVLSYKRLG